jgi:prepilin-type N-terminal cleavage/methylation domain-containing protein
MNTMPKLRSKGFSLVELMIALVIGLVVVGAVLSFTLSSVTTNSEYIQSTRLSQELRNSMDFVSRELRRAGYDQNNASYTARSTATAPVISPFGRIFASTDANGDGTANDSCIIYAYDRDAGTRGTIDLAQGEIRAIRMGFTPAGVGVIEVAQSAAGVTPNCTGTAPDYTKYPATCSAAGWCALSDPNVVNLTEFNITRTDIVQPGTATTTPVVIREFGVELQGRLVRSADGVVTRGIRSDVKVRADCLEASTVCDDAPTGT